jgi:hypothetical protein
LYVDFGKNFEIGLLYLPQVTIINMETSMWFGCFYHAQNGELRKIVAQGCPKLESFNNIDLASLSRVSESGHWLEQLRAFSASKQLCTLCNIDYIQTFQIFGTFHQKTTYSITFFWCINKVFFNKNISFNEYIYACFREQMYCTAGQYLAPTWSQFCQFHLSKFMISPDHHISSSALCAFKYLIVT